MRITRPQKVLINKVMWTTLPKTLKALNQDSSKGTIATEPRKQMYLKGQFWANPDEWGHQLKADLVKHLSVPLLSYNERGL